MCHTVIRTHGVSFSSELPQNFRGKASPPGKLAPKATDRAGRGPSYDLFVRISILRIDLPSHRLRRSSPEGEPDCLPVEAIGAKLLRQLVTYVPCRK